jgi:hypothetical protein
LVARKEASVSFLEERLLLRAAVKPEQVGRLIEDLDSDSFAMREKATQELGELGELAEPDLRRALNSRVSPELRKRVGRLLDRLGPAPSPERLRVIRAVAVLEYVATDDALALLGMLTKGPKEAWLTQEASAARDRLVSRSETGGVSSFFP